MTQQEKFYVGTYSQSLGDMEANGKGIYTCTIDLDSGVLQQVSCAAVCVNPSYLTWGAARKHLYATSEVFYDANPALLAFNAGPDGALELLNSQPVSGELPCHVTVDKSGHFLASAQYWSGNAQLHSLKSNGEIGAQIKKIQHHASGLHNAQQKDPRAHFVQFFTDPDELVVVDLGLDQIIAYPFDYASGDIDMNNTRHMELPVGAGPRHLVTPTGTNKIFVFCEYSESIFAFERIQGIWTQVQLVQAFQKTNDKNGAAAAIKMAPDGHHLYVSGRTTSQIACFSVNAKNHKLTLEQRIGTDGIGPRDFELSSDGQFIVVANQLSNNLTSFRRDPKNGQITSTGHQLDLGSPVCVVF